MPLYESVIICRQDITKNQLDIIISEFKKNIENEKGKILNEEYWGLKNLAYEINKNKKAHYTMLIIESHPDKIEEYADVNTEANIRMAWFAGALYRAQVTQYKATQVTMRQEQIKQYNIEISLRNVGLKTNVNRIMVALSAQEKNLISEELKDLVNLIIN